MGIKAIGQELKAWFSETWETVKGNLGSHSVEKKNSSSNGDNLFQFLKDSNRPLSPEEIKGLQDKFTVRDKTSFDSIDIEGQKRFLNNLPDSTKFNFSNLTTQEKTEFIELIDETFPKKDLMTAALFIDSKLDYNPYLNMLAFRAKLQQ